MTNHTTLLELVKNYSPSGHEAPAVDYLVQRMKDLGFTHAYKDEVGNAIGVMGEGTRQIVLLGHIDTVPGEIPVRVVNNNVGATGRSVRVENGILHGRGSVDAKGPLSSFVDAVASLGQVRGWQMVVIGARLMKIGNRSGRGTSSINIIQNTPSSANPPAGTESRSAIRGAHAPR